MPPRVGQLEREALAELHPKERHRKRDTPGAEVEPLGLADEALETFVDLEKFTDDCVTTELLGRKDFLRRPITLLYRRLDAVHQHVAHLGRDAAVGVRAVGALSGPFEFRDRRF